VGVGRPALSTALTTQPCAPLENDVPMYGLIKLKAKKAHEISTINKAKQGK